MANLNIVVISGENLNKEIVKIGQQTGKSATIDASSWDWYAINAYPDNDPGRIGDLIHAVLEFYPIDAQFAALPGWQFNIIREGQMEALRKNFKVVEVTELCPKPKVKAAEPDGVVEEKQKEQVI